ncbi:MAG TPA: LpxD N-terminal domain-containing protein [Ferruginibacter sp.]|nr:LpxD N-terminal domain-containing protein [Ferruginibacter sp.]
MRFTAGQVAAIINGKIEGDAEQAVTSFGKIEEAREGQLAFLANPKYEDFLYTSGASVIIISNTLELRQPISATIIRVADPYSSFAALLDKYQELKTMQLSGSLCSCNPPLNWVKMFTSALLCTWEKT